MLRRGGRAREGHREQRLQHREAHERRPRQYAPAGQQAPATVPIASTLSTSPARAGVALPSARAPGRRRRSPRARRAAPEQRRSGTTAWPGARARGIGRGSRSGLERRGERLRGRDAVPPSRPAAATTSAPRGGARRRRSPRRRAGDDQRRLLARRVERIDVLQPLAALGAGRAQTARVNGPSGGTTSAGERPEGTSTTSGAPADPRRHHERPGAAAQASANATARAARGGRRSARGRARTYSSAGTRRPGRPWPRSSP